MKYWKVSYYKKHNWIDKKYIKDEFAQGAINKARVKSIVDVQEITDLEPPRIFHNKRVFKHIF